MANFKVELSVNGLRNIPVISIRNDFEFIVGEVHPRYPSFVAASLSRPKDGELRYLHRRQAWLFWILPFA
jgi:hypothetical protein